MTIADTPTVRRPGRGEMRDMVHLLRLQNDRLRLTEMEAQAERAREMLMNSVNRALDAGEPITAVAAASGYSRQWLHAFRAFRS